MQRLSAGLVATFITVVVSTSLKAEISPCARAYNVAASVMSARQYGVLLPEVLDRTNALVSILEQKQGVIFDEAVREMIVSAYKVKRGSFPDDAVIDEFANSFALRCVEGKDERLANLGWDLRTDDAFAGWTRFLESKKEAAKREEAFEQAKAEAKNPEELKKIEKRHKLIKRLAEHPEKPFGLIEAPARASEKLKKKEEAKLAFLDALSKAKSEGNALDQMTTRITKAWGRPSGFKGGLEVLLRMSLVSNGELVDVRILKSSGDALFDRSAITAVEQAAPFDEVKQFDEATFEEKFRSMTIKFRPKD